ncbi:integral membrane protein [Xylariaceae sp. FL0662B]|nr:integral membrane protein [Xylariaceae sp. FL0662B]
MSVPGTIWLPMPAIVREHLIGNVIMAFFGLTMTGLRLYSRTISVGFGLDDGFIAVGAVLGLVLIIQQGIYSTIGEGYDFDPNSAAYPALLNNLPTLLKITFSFQLIYMNSLTCIKFSILFFYRRVFNTRQMFGTIRLVYATMGLVVVWTLGIQLTEIFICHPVSYWWDQTIEGGYCDNQVPIYTALIIVNVITDFIIMGLPMVPIWRLQMRTAEKLALMGAFALGFASIIVGIVRLVTVFAVDMMNNVTGSIEMAVFLCTLESLLALVCVNVPMLRPLYRRYVNQTTSSKLQDGEQSGQGKGSKISSVSKNNNTTHTYAERDAEGGWEMKNYTVTETEADSFNDGSSEKKLTKYADGTRPSQGQIAVRTEWEITRG